MPPASDTARTQHISVKFELVKRVLVWHAPVIIVCVVRVCAELLHLLERIIRVLSMLLLKFVCVEFIRLSLVFCTLLDVDTLSTLKSRIVKVVKQLTNRVLLTGFIVLTFALLIFAAVIAILKLTVPQALDLIDLLGAEFAPLFILLNFIGINLFRVAFVFFYLSQGSQFESNLSNLTHVHSLGSIA